MPLIHIVLFKFQASLNDAEVKEVRCLHLPCFVICTEKYQKICDEMLALRTNCINPQTNKPYIITSSGGKDNSPEGAQVCLIR